MGDSDGGGYTKECRRVSMDSLSDARKVGRAAAGECRGGCSGGGNTLRGTAGMCPGSARQGQQREPCAHLWALPASRHARHGCPARPAAWRPGWTRRGCSPLPRPCGRCPTGCLRTRETGLCAGAAHIGVGEPAPQHCPCSCPVPTQPRAIKCTSPSTCHHVLPSCSGGAEAPKGAATTMPPPHAPPGSPTCPMQPQPPHLPAMGTGSPLPAAACATLPTHHPAGPWHSLSSAGTAPCPATPRPGATAPHGPKHCLAPSAPRAQRYRILGTAFSMLRCPMGTVLCGPGHSLPRPLLSHGHSQTCPTGTAALTSICPLSRACPELPLSHEHSLLHPMAEHHLPGHSSALSPSVPQAQPVASPPPQGHSAHCGASPSRGIQGACGCRHSPCLGAQPSWGAHGRGAASAVGPVAPSLHPPARCAVGLGWAVGKPPAARPPGAVRPGAPSYLHGKKEERFGVRWQVI